MYAREVGYYRVLPLLLPITKSLSYFSEPAAIYPLSIFACCGVTWVQIWLPNFLTIASRDLRRRACAKLMLMLALLLTLTPYAIPFQVVL